jgi:hypothetical protein
MFCWQTLDAEELLAKITWGRDFLFHCSGSKCNVFLHDQNTALHCKHLTYYHYSPDNLIISTMAETKKVWEPIIYSCEFQGFLDFELIAFFYLLQWARIFFCLWKLNQQHIIVRDLLFLPLIRWVGAPNKSF